jgi:hypothetical protein
MAYFFVAVSNSENLGLCRDYALAGFPGSRNGAWSFADIREGDYVSFVYGAKAYDLYEVDDRVAVSNAAELPPWDALELSRGGTYHFPFRLSLERRRSFEESMVRSEFRYIAENLLLRGGYRRSHFQADKTTLQQVSQMGEPSDGELKEREWTEERAEPRWVRRRGGFESPTENQFIEEVLHALVRHRLGNEGEMEEFAEMTGLGFLEDSETEVLGERALPEGHLDLLVKEKEPTGTSHSVPIEVKLNRCTQEDMDQLRGYMEQLAPECMGGVLLAETFPRSLDVPSDVSLVRARFNGIDMSEPQTLEQMAEALELAAVDR